MSKQEDLLEQKLRSCLGRVRIIRNFRPDWLKNPTTNRPMEIDIYLPDFRLGIEFQGFYHFNSVTKDDRKVDWTRYKDTIKHAIARKRKVYIIEFFESDLTEKFSNLLIDKITTVCPLKIQDRLKNRIDTKRKSDSLKCLMKFSNLSTR